MVLTKWKAFNAVLSKNVPVCNFIDQEKWDSDRCTTLIYMSFFLLISTDTDRMLFLLTQEHPIQVYKDQEKRDCNTPVVIQE